MSKACKIILPGKRSVC